MALVERGHDVTILTAMGDQDYLKPLGVRVVSLFPRTMRWAHYRSVFSRSRAREVLGVINRIQPDVIHGHLLSWQLGFLWIHEAVRRGIPVFFTCHSSILIAYGKVMGTERSLMWRDLWRMRWQWNPLRNILIRRALRKTHILYVSSALQSFFMMHGYPEGTVLHNGIDVQFWKPGDKASARSQRNLPTDVPLFLFAGRLGADKGMDFLWKVWQQLRGDPHLLLAGVLSISVPAHLQEKVHLFPDQSREDLRALYRAADAILVPSQYLDPFPTVCLESLSCGRPVLATSLGGVQEAIADGVGWILDVTNAEVWRERIQWCIDHRAALQGMGTNARGHAEARFSLELHVDILLTFYRNALSQCSYRA